MSFEDPAHPPTTTCDRFLETDRSEASTDSSSSDDGSGRQRGVASQRNVALCEAEAVVLAKQTAFSRLGAFCISNPLLPDCPLTYCNKTFSEQTGFEPEDIVGRNCRFLQCGETSRETVAAMGECVSHFRRRRRGDGDVGAQTFRIIQHIFLNPNCPLVSLRQFNRMDPGVGGFGLGSQELPHVD